MYQESWQTKKITDVVKELTSSTEQGLTTHEAQARLRQIGPNKIVKKTSPWYWMLLHQFTSPFILLLLGAATLSFLVKNFGQGLIIIIMLGINACMEFYQEYRSSRILELLQTLIVSSVVVLRDGKKVIISEENLVPGDMVILAAGDKIPADMRLIFAEGLLLDESLLTGESLAVSKIAGTYSDPHKARKNSCCFAGSTVVAGQGMGIVTRTGNTTELGTITKLATEVSITGVFARDLRRFTWLMITVILGAFCLVLGIKLYLQTGDYSLLDVLMFALVIAVSITPESLPVIITFSLAQAAHALAKDRVVIKKLSSLNDLGSIEILCVDKTGTLTENRLKVIDIWENNPEAVVWGFLGSGQVNAETLKDPLDKALWEQLSPDEQAIVQSSTVISELPFDPTTRRSGAIVQQDNSYWLVYRGAFESLINQCEQPTPEKLSLWFNQQKKEARKIFAVTRTKLTADMLQKEFDKERLPFSLVGCFACIDPVKTTVTATLERARTLSVTIKVISGDSAEVVSAVGRQVGLLDTNSAVLLGDDFEAMNATERAHAAKKYQAFARVTPQQKYAIVQTLQKQHAIGFLGDGINDAPVLKLADVGIAVQGSVPIAQEAADVILLEKSIHGIIDGIEAGRRALVNAKKYLTGTLSLNMANGLGLVALSLLVPFLPVLPAQLLLLHSLVDTPMFALAVDRVAPERLAKPTRFNFLPLLIFICGVALIGAGFSISFFTLFYDHPLAELRSVWFSMSVVVALIVLFCSRSYVPFWQAPRPAWPLVTISMLVTLLAFAIPNIPTLGSWFEFVPPQLSLLLQASLIVLACLFCIELFKYIFNSFKGEK